MKTIVQEPFVDALGAEIYQSDLMCRRRRACTSVPAIQFIHISIYFH